MWLFLLFAIASLVYIICRRKHQYWKNRKIPFVKPTFFFGHSLPFLLGKENNHLMLKRFYDSVPNVPYVGCFEGLNPVLIVRDPAAVVDVTIKHSSHFDGRYIPWFMRQNEKLNPLSQNIFTDEGNRWKVMRQKLTHVFSSTRGRKILLDISSNTVQEMETAIDNSHGPVDLQDVCLRYIVDVIGYWIFGIKCDSFGQGKSDFVNEAGNMFDNNYTFRFLLYAINPKMLDWLNIADFPERGVKFFTNLMRENIKYRKENNIKTGDFLDVLVSAVEEPPNEKDDLKKNYSEIDIFGNIFLAIAAGYDSTGMRLTFALYELAINVEIQEKVRQEIKTVLNQHNGKLDIDTLSDLKYLEMVILEITRKYPADGALFRQCTEDYVIPGTTSRIDAGTEILIPTYGLHYDPTLFPDPERFDPERFSPENKASIPKGAYVGFGEGQRICIGMKAALVIMKVAIVSIVSKYKLSPCKKTPNRINWEGGYFILKPTEALVVEVEKLD